MATTLVTIERTTREIVQIQGKYTPDQILSQPIDLVRSQGVIVGKAEVLCTIMSVQAQP